VDLLSEFEAQARRVGATVHRCPPQNAATESLKLLRQAGCASVALAANLPQRSAFVAALSSEDLAETSTSTLWPTRRADGGVSLARLGVAETGSVLLHSSSEDRRVELCVDLHLVLLETTSLVATLDQAFAVLREIGARPPAYASLVSGPSRSADIERTLTIGVHGPRELYIVLVGAGP